MEPVSCSVPDCSFVTPAHVSIGDQIKLLEIHSSANHPVKIEHIFDQKTFKFGSSKYFSNSIILSDSPLQELERSWGSILRGMRLKERSRESRMKKL